ncbi:MAG: signal transduction histidine kinase [Micrococcales bacterium 32-70-13]|nr:MAG: signal transduction histidine kinase [Micrococcales bacterium 32-70-13]
MTRSEFLRAIVDEFGEAYGRSLLRDLVLTPLGECTADEALGAGAPPREVWLALCAAMDVPRERWYGAGRPEPKRV